MVFEFLLRSPGSCEYKIQQLDIKNGILQSEIRDLEQKRNKLNDEKQRKEIQFNIDSLKNRSAKISRDIEDVTKRKIELWKKTKKFNDLPENF